jgi:hypothetical protein
MSACGLVIMLVILEFLLALCRKKNIFFSLIFIRQGRKQI